MHYGLSAGKAEVGRCLGLLGLDRDDWVSERPCLQKGRRKCLMIDSKVDSGLSLYYVHKYPEAHMNIYT